MISVYSSYAARLLFGLLALILASLLEMHVYKCTASFHSADVQLPVELSNNDGNHGTEPAVVRLLF
jgi:hypothetical protein